MGLEFQPGAQEALSLVEIPTPQVRFAYPPWTIMMDWYIPFGVDPFIRGLVSREALRSHKSCFPLKRILG